MPDSSQQANLLNWLIGAAAVVIVIAGLQAAQSLVVPFLISSFLAVVCTPALHWLQEKRMPTALALLLVLGGVSVVCLVVGAVAVASIQDFISEIDAIRTRLIDLKVEFFAWLEEKGLDLPDESNVEVLSVQRIASVFATFLGSLTGLFSNALLVLLTLLFMLLEASGLPKKLVAMADGKPELSRQAERVRNAIIQYVSLKSVISLLTGALVALLTWSLGVKYAVLWGLLAFFFNFVPNIGSFIAAAPAILVAIALTDVRTTVLVSIGYLAINGIIGNFLEPRLMGRGLGLSTLVVFLSLVFWGWVLGPVGMLLSVPLTMIVKISLENFDDTRWIAVLLSANPSK